MRPLLASLVALLSVSAAAHGIAAEPVDHEKVVAIANTLKNQVTDIVKPKTPVSVSVVTYELTEKASRSALQPRMYFANQAMAQYLRQGPINEKGTKPISDVVGVDVTQNEVADFRVNQNAVLVVADGSHATLRSGAEIPWVDTEGKPHSTAVGMDLSFTYRPINGRDESTISYNFKNAAVVDYTREGDVAIPRFESNEIAGTTMVKKGMAFVLPIIGPKNDKTGTIPVTLYIIEPKDA